MSQRIILQHQSITSKLLILVGLALFSLGIFSILSIVLASSVYHLPILSNPGILKETSNPNVIPALKMMQVMQALGLFILPTFVFAKLDSTKMSAYLSLNKKPLFYSLICAVLIMLCAQPLINWMADINGQMPAPAWMHESEKEAAAITKIFLEMNNYGDLLVNLFMIALIPAIGEELLFRGLFQPLFQKLTKNPHLGIWLSAILFSALHMQFLGFFPRMFMGAAFGYLLLWSGSLWLPIIGHFVNNAGAVIIAFMIQKAGMPQELETVGVGEGAILYVLVSTFLVGVLLFLVRKNELGHEQYLSSPVED
ncbi:MAG TPA: CPBP family intramembrane metalloprotease [Bacteroidia bacterium]|nr:CPBP family intramembrane metalloprotease [Bacteroidia bacterium]